MTKSELIQILADRNPHLYLRDVEKIVDTSESVKLATEFKFFHPYPGHPAPIWVSD